jgi:hypothetical protein
MVDFDRALLKASRLSANANWTSSKPGYKVEINESDKPESRCSIFPLDALAPYA